MHRRDFLKLAATSGTGAVIFTGCNMTKYAGTWGDGDPKHEFQEESPVLNPNDLNYHRDAWYATAHPGYGSGLVVRVFEGRAKKVDGNPEFPLNQGRSMPFEQALLQEVYHPDRIPEPQELHAGAARGSGKFDPITNQEAALARLYTMINGAKGQPNGIVLMTGPVSGTQLAIINEFNKATGAKHMVVDRDENVVLREAVTRVFGTPTLPSMDLAGARTVVSFGAEFLTDWISPVQFQAGYGEFRQGRDNVRGTFWYVGPQLTATAASADQWLPIRPGTEGYVALAVAQGLGGGAAAAYPGVQLGQFTPEAVADRAAPAGMDRGDFTRRVNDLINDFKSGPSLAVAGGSAAAQTNGLFNVMAALSLNVASGNVGKPGGIILNPGTPVTDLLPASPPAIPYRNLQSLGSMLQGTKLILIHNFNPVHDVPMNPPIASVLTGSGAQIVSFSPFFDETAMIADLIIPDVTTLESWGAFVPDPGPGYPVVAMQQPVVENFTKGIAFGDVLLTAARNAGGSPPWQTAKDAVMAAVTGLRGAGGGNIQAPDDKAFFLQMQTQGGWWDQAKKGPAALAAPRDLPAPADPAYAGDPGQYPFYLLPYPHNTLGYGEGAHLPWLQALPEPITTAVWGTWVELNPKTADKLGVEMGDVVKLTSPTGTIEVPVFVSPAAAPDVALVPMGNGHTASGRYAEKRGVNPMSIVATQLESQTGALAWGSTRVKITKADKKVRLALFQGSVQPYQEEGFPIIQTTLPRTT